MQYQSVIIDAKNLFRQFFYSIRDEQSKLFKTNEHLGDVIPVNNYILVFDTIMRLLIRTNKFVESIKSKYSNKLIDNAPFYLSMVSENGWFINRLDTHYTRKTLNYNDFRDQLYVVINQIYQSVDMFNQNVISYCDFLCQEFRLNIPHSYTMISTELRNKIVKQFIYLVSLYQSTLTMSEIKYVYEVMCRYSGLKLISKVNSQTVTNSIYVTNSTRVNSYKNVMIVDFDLKIVGFESPTSIKVNPIPHKPFKLLKLKDLCDSSVHQVVKMNDDTLILIIDNIKSTYEINEHISNADSLIPARSISHSDYESLKIEFIKIASLLLADEQKEIVSLFK